ncbi:hypothetical protein ABZP36_009809 [Zizania latifolia]
MARCAWIADALALFVEMRGKGHRLDAWMFNALMRACVKENMHQEAVRLFDEMSGAKIEPDQRLFNFSRFAKYKIQLDMIECSILFVQALSLIDLLLLLLKMQQGRLAWQSQSLPDIWPRALQIAAHNKGPRHVGAQHSGLAVPQPEHALHHRQLRRRRVGTAEGHPVVDRHAGGQHLAPPVDGASGQGHLQ